MALLTLEYPKGVSEISDNAQSTNDTVSFVRFDIYERKGANTQELRRGINLYMPETMENPTNVSWDMQSLGAGGVHEGSWKDYSQSAERLQNATESLVESMKSKIYGGSQASGQDILAFRQQKVVNPHMKMLFRGVNFRNFEMQFKFTPKSADESKVIYNIIQEFRAAALPSNAEGGFKWNYPSELAITYKYQGKDHPWLNKFKRCVITDCHVNYTSAGFYASMRDGFPAETELRLQFSEVDLLTREDIKIEGSKGEY